MTKRFVIGVEGLSENDEKSLARTLEKRGGWWHWIDNFWLFITDEDSISTGELRDTIKQINLDARSLVVEVSGVRSWSGKGPNREGNNMFDWIHEEWKK